MTNQNLVKTEASAGETQNSSLRNLNPDRSQPELQHALSPFLKSELTCPFCLCLLSQGCQIVLAVLRRYSESILQDWGQYSLLSILALDRRAALIMSLRIHVTVSSFFNHTDGARSAALVCFKYFHSSLGVLYRAGGLSHFPHEWPKYFVIQALSGEKCCQHLTHVRAGSVHCILAHFRC